MQIDLPVVKKISPPDWARSKNTKRVFAALDHKALFVGGCVRDALMGNVSADVDIATPLKPQEVMDALNAAQIHAIPTGIDHGTVTAVYNKQSYEITTLRRDVETDGRRAVVAYTDSWHEDSQRRDFTFNSLLMDLSGQVYDPVGCGVNDLEQRKVAFIGDARERVKEDYLRILRYFRFATRYGMAFDDGVLSMFEEEADGLRNVSIERISEELLKILSSNEPQSAIDCLKQYEAFSWVSGEITSLDAFCQVQMKYNSLDVLGRLYVISDGERIIRPDVFSLSNKQKDHLMEIGKVVNAYAHSSSNHLLYHYCPKAVMQGVSYLYIREQITEHTLKHLYSKIQSWVKPVFPLKGANLIHEGYKPGKIMGDALRAVEEWWIEQAFEPNADACMIEAIKWLNQQGVKSE